LRDEVADIITEEERRAFLGLSTNEEREQFVEIFWNRRNPEPGSPTAVKEEHYRRLAYADEHFASGIPGRKTHRGHMYIIWGPPDEIETHPTGGMYDRPLGQGGGSTTTYPWELWRYRHLEGVGENIEIEFIDPSGSGEYHITADPCEKDALAHIPSGGASLSEMLGRSTRAGRFSNSSGTTCPMLLGGVTANATSSITSTVISGSSTRLNILKTWGKKSLLAWCPTNSPSSIARTFCEQLATPTWFRLRFSCAIATLACAMSSGMPRPSKLRAGSG
jgi:GWxTD domain-containing protein